jgi:carboxyl-terminal processing protease
MSEKRISSLWIALLGVLIGALAVATYYKVNDRNARLKSEYRDWRKLNLVLQKVTETYVDTVDFEKVSEAAINAALAQLDPHTVYLPPETLEASESELAGNFDGIGIQFNVPNDTAVVIEVIPGGPSERIGLQAGDRIIKVGGTNIAGVKFPQDSMVRRMKGPSGSQVEVTVLRDGELIPFQITRGKIPVHSIDASFMVNDTTGYIRLSKFSRTTYTEFLSAAAGLLGSGMTHLVFDLRDNTGGYLEQALSLADMFLSKDDMIVYMEGLHSPREDFKASGKGLMQNVGITVIINESSASSSEIFAGAIQDNDRGVIVGRRSFGKGLVQSPVFFTDGSGLRITIARYYTPSGRCIQKPYTEDYDYDIYKRYADGELTDADSIKVNKDEAFQTVGGRTVYGGGGIVPDVFVPMDTTRATDFYIACNRKATSMRFASDFFDKHKARLSVIEDYDTLQKFLKDSDVESGFLQFASSVDGLRPKAGEWAKSRVYMMPQVKALVGRYSKLGENAFYHQYLEVDETLIEAVKPHDLFAPTDGKK